MKREEILEVLVKTGCVSVNEGAEPDFDTFRLLEDPIVTNRMAVELLQKLPDGTKLDSVLSLCDDGMLFGYSVATAAWARFITADVKDGKIAFRNKACIKKKDNVLIVDDLLEPSSELETLEKAVKEAGAKTIGVIAIARKGSVSSTQTPIYELIEF